MKVLILTPKFHPIIGGGETYTLNLSRKLYASGIHIVVATEPHPQRNINDYKFKVKEIPGLSDDSLDLYQSIPKLHETLVEFEPDVIHTHGYFGLLVASLSTHNVPVVASVHSSPVQNKRVFGSFNNFAAEVTFAQNVVRAAAPRVFISGSKSYLSMAKMIVNNRIRLEFLPYPVDADFFGEIQGSKTSRAILNKDTIVMLPSRIIERKGVAEAIEALAYLDKRFKLSLPGAYLPADKDFWQRIKTGQAWKKYRCRVIIPKKPAYYDDLPMWYQESDIIIMPSYYEGYGLAALEAMSAGKPVIGTNVQGLNEVIEHERNGLLIPAKNPRALASAITRLHQDKKLEATVIKNGRRYAQEHSWVKHIAEVRSLYESIL